MILYLLTLFSLFTRFYKFITGENFVWRQWLPKLFSFIVCLYFNFNFSYSYAIFRLIGLAIDGLLVMLDSVEYLLTNNKLKEGWKVYTDVIAMHIFYRILLKLPIKTILLYVVDCCLSNHPIIALILNCLVIPFLYNCLIKRVAYALWPKARTIVFTFVPELWCYLSEYYAKAYHKVIVPGTKKVVSDICEMFITIEQACAKIKGAQSNVAKEDPDYETYDILCKVITEGGIFERIPKNFKSYINNLVSFTQCCMTIKDESSFGFVKNGSIMLNHVDEPIVENFALSSIVAVDNKTITHLLPVVNGQCYMLKNKPIPTSGYVRPSNEGKGRNQRPLHKKSLNQVKVAYTRSTTSTVLPPVYVNLKGKTLSMTKDEYLEFLKDYKHSGWKYSDGFNPSTVENVRLSVPLKKSYSTVPVSSSSTTVIKSVPVVNVAQRVPVFQDDKPKAYHDVVDKDSWSLGCDSKPVVETVKPVIESAKPKTTKSVKSYGYMKTYSDIFEDFEYVETLMSKHDKLLLVLKADISGCDDDDICNTRRMLYDYGNRVHELKTIEYDDYKTGERVELESDEETMYIMICLPGRQDRKLEEEHRHKPSVYNRVIKSTKLEEDQNVSADYDSDGEEIKTYHCVNFNTPNITTTESEHFEFNF